MRRTDLRLLRGRPNRAERLIARAIEAGERIRLDYASSSRKRLRTLSPYEIRDGIVIAWDHDRWDFRTFRLDRVQRSAYVREDAYQASEEL